MPVTEVGKPLQDLVEKLEEDVKRDTDLLRDLDRRFKSNNRELERLGNTACQQRAALQQKVITDSIGAVFTGLKAAAELNQTTKIMSMLKDTNKQTILNLLRKLIDPLLDEDNWIAAITYFTTRNRIEQYDELNVTQLAEWQAHTCNLQRHTKTLRDARTRLANPTTTSSKGNSTTPPKTGVGAGKIAALTVAAAATVGVGVGVGGYRYYRSVMDENEAFLSDFGNINPPGLTGVRAFDGTYDFRIPASLRNTRTASVTFILSRGIIAVVKAPWRRHSSAEASA